MASGWRDVDCMELAAVIGEAASEDLPDGLHVFVTIFDDEQAAAAYGTGPFERTKAVLADMLTAAPAGPTAEA